MAKKLVVKLAANFERNLADIERFLSEAEVPHAYDALLDELLATLIPNLERFPDMGRPFLSRAICSVEATNALAALGTKLSALAPASRHKSPGLSLGQLRALVPEPDRLREYIMDHYLVLYAQIGGKIYLLSIRHHRQLSFDFDAHWGAKSSQS